MSLSLEALTLAESLRNLGVYGSGPVPGTVVLSDVMLTGFAAAAQELLDAAQSSAAPRHPGGLVADAPGLGESGPGATPSRSTT